MVEFRRLSYFVRNLVRAAIFLASLSMVQPANAATLFFTYKGTVSSGSDYSNVFGLGSGANIIGQAYTSVYTLTYPSPGALNYSTSSLNILYGGNYYSVPNPVSGQITINGVTRKFSGGLFSQHVLGLITAESYSSVENQVCGTSFNNILSNSIASDTRPLVNSLEFNQPVHVFGQNGDYVPGGSLRISHVTNGNFFYDTDIKLNTQSITSGLAGSVPEPSTWAMMIMGLAGVGVAMRRRRRIVGCTPLFGN